MAKKAKPKNVKTIVTKVKEAKRMSKTFRTFDVYVVLADGRWGFQNALSTQKQAERYIKETPALISPVIVAIVIEPMEY